MQIRRLKNDDREIIISLMETFYSSPAVSTNGSIKIFNDDFDACVGDCPYLEGYAFIKDDQIIGYGMLAKSFSTEFGKSCIWIEDLYLTREYQGLGYGSKFIQFVFDKYPNSVIRLEVEEENKRAIRSYTKNQFTALPYLEMIRFPNNY